MGTEHIGGYGPAILGLHWAMYIVATVLCILRGIYARKKNSRWRWDFIWIVMTQVLCTFSTIFVTLSCYHGLGNHLADIGYKEASLAGMWSLPVVYLGSLSVCLSKFSVVALLLDVQSGTRGLRKSWPLYLVAASFAITTVLQIFGTAFACTPYRKNYDLLGPGRCNLRSFQLYTSYLHAGESITDTYL